MTAPGDHRPIVLKRKKVAGGGRHHGGAWKVAYADFVTAMMTFFMLMWLLNATSKDQRKGLADYFDPNIPISRTSAGGAGMLEGRTLFAETTAAGGADAGVPPKPTRQPAGPPDDKERKPADAQTGETTAEDGPSPAPGSDDQSVSAAEVERLAAERAEQERLEAISRDLAEAARRAANGALEQHFYLRSTPEGLVIEIIEADGEPLFASASSEPAEVLPLLVDILVPMLQRTTNDIAVDGHADAVPFGNSNYSNWELSADRANAARRLLTAAGVPEARIRRVTGKAAVEPLVANPLAAQNRRISITLLRESTR